MASVPARNRLLGALSSLWRRMVSRRPRPVPQIVVSPHLAGSLPIRLPWTLLSRLRLHRERAATRRPGRRFAPLPRPRIPGGRQARPGPAGAGPLLPGRGVPAPHGGLLPPGRDRSPRDNRSPAGQDRPPDPGQAHRAWAAERASAPTFRPGLVMPGLVMPGLVMPGLVMPGLVMPGGAAPRRGAGAGGRHGAAAGRRPPLAARPSANPPTARHGTPAARLTPHPLIAPPPAGPSVGPPHPAGELPVLGSAPLPPGSAPGPTGAVRTPPPVTGQRAAGTGRTPRQRWESAVAAGPLEAPRPLPGSLHAMARAITGRPHPPRYTAGPATRRALAAAGALGATTGSVIHLPEPPTGASAVLAHELTHARRPVSRPRFFLAGALPLLDDDERSALGAGRALAGALPGAPGDAGTVGAGIVDRLPVGGGLAAVGDAATRAARAAAIEAAALPRGPAALAGAGEAALAGARDHAHAEAGSLAGAGGQALAGAAGALLPAVPGAALPEAPGGGAAPAGALDPDRVVAIVEERLLREIERRGGRWAEVF